MNEPVEVIKLNPAREETRRYSGQVLRLEPEAVLIEAYFDRDDLPFHGITFGRGDRFVELYFADRWYNIFELHDRDDDHVKGWYCNVTRPAEFEPGYIRYVDLALDLLVYPDGRQVILDEDEFAALAIDEVERRDAWQALEALRQIFQSPVSLRLETISAHHIK